MSATSFTQITLGADVGGKDAQLATHGHVTELRTLLRDECVRAYSAQLTRIDLVLRIDGSVHAWKKSGVDFVTLRPSKGHATADIFVPPTVSSQRSSGAKIRRFFAAGVDQALREIVKRAQQRKLPVDEESLFADAGRAIAKFLA